MQTPEPLGQQARWLDLMSEHNFGDLTPSWFGALKCWFHFASLLWKNRKYCLLAVPSENCYRKSYCYWNSVQNSFFAAKKTSTSGHTNEVLSVFDSGIDLIIYGDSNVDIGVNSHSSETKDVSIAVSDFLHNEYVLEEWASFRSRNTVPEKLLKGLSVTQIYSTALSNLPATSAMNQTYCQVWRPHQ